MNSHTTARDLQRVPFHVVRSEEHTSELQSQSNLVCRLLLEKNKHLPTADQCGWTTPRRPTAWTTLISRPSTDRLGSSVTTTNSMPVSTTTLSLASSA